MRIIRGYNGPRLTKSFRFSGQKSFSARCGESNGRDIKRCLGVTVSNMIMVVQKACRRTRN